MVLAVMVFSVLPEIKPLDCGTEVPLSVSENMQDMI